MTNEIADMELGASRLLFGSAGSEVDLGPTEGGCRLAVEFAWRDVTVDEFGDSLVDKAHMGSNATIVCSLRAITLSNLLVAFPEATEQTGYVTMGKAVAGLASAVAGKLLVRPYAEGAGNTRDVELYLAFVEAVGEVTRDNEGHEMLEVTFRALRDTSRAAGDQLLRFRTPNT